ncbi:MAG: MFS transporter [Chitinophagales bacterium]|nr:MFS transporter [Chitinophagales bacterium]
MKKPLLPASAIWNMSFGFLGIQTGFALQNANASRILQTLGANTDELGFFWLVAPITGMVVQPIIGHYSDKTWTKMGRRKPYFLLGAIMAAIGLILMPNSALFTAFLPALWIGAGMLMLMDISFNVAMEPFRALVADKLSTDQRTAGFAIQTILIGLGAVIGSWLPSILVSWFGISATASSGHVPDNVVYAFIIGAIILLAAILWTIVTTPEYSPEALAEFQDSKTKNPEPTQSKWLFQSIFQDVREMPKTMRQLGLVQFCAWFGLFGMWVYSTPAIAEHVYGLEANDTTSPLFQEAGNKVGYLFGIYNLVSAIYAFALPAISKRIGRKYTHALSMAIGGIGLISIFFISNPDLLVLPMLGIGIAWASILAMPYAMLAGSISPIKMGVYMGIFNFFITLPQIANGVIGGLLLKHIYNNQAIFAIITAGIFMLIGAIASIYVDDQDDLALLKTSK